MIKLRDANPDAVDCMVTFMYKQQYPVEKLKGTSVEDAGLHIDTWIVADQYDVQDLARYAASRFSSSISMGGWKLKVFGSWVARVFQDTPAHSPLREHCIRVASRNANELYKGSPDYQAYIAATSALPGFATQVLIAHFTRPGAQNLPNLGFMDREVMCPACEHIFVCSKPTQTSSGPDACPNCLVTCIDWNRCGINRPRWQPATRFPEGFKV